MWVLTGDKIETAINIGYSCKLLNRSLKERIIDIDKIQNASEQNLQKDVGQQIKDLISSIKQEKKNGVVSDQNALIISGEALIYALKPSLEKDLVEITKYCSAVLCCRVSPKQKQEIVTLVRKYNNKDATLAIGDGANDVNMITAAHVGIGIRGLEGQQAARVSDYAIGEFKILRHLLFFHGRESYRKNSNLVCYNFYKNIVMVLPQFWFGIQNGFSGISLYDAYAYQLYNVFYTSIPIIIYAVFD